MIAKPVKDPAGIKKKLIPNGRQSTPKVTVHGGEKLIFLLLSFGIDIEVETDEYGT